MARERPVALILRRGPSNWYHLILWSTRDDAFEHGAWFKGRIYEQRCDLSPDGSLLVTFALQGSRWGTSYRGTWTAVSRPPWLHALVLWPHGDTWGGGGRFIGPRKLALWTGLDTPTHPDHPLVGLEVELDHEPEVASADFGVDDWRGVDHAGHAIRARGGKLFRERDGAEVEIADFSDLTPDPQPPPASAKRPLSRLPTKNARRRKRS